MCLSFTKELNQEIADTNPHTVLKNLKKLNCHSIRQSFSFSQQRLRHPVK